MTDTLTRLQAFLTYGRSLSGDEERRRFFAIARRLHQAAAAIIAATEFDIQIINDDFGKSIGSD